MYHVHLRPDLGCRTRLLALRLQIACTEDMAPAVVRRVDGMARLVQRVSDILRIRRHAAVKAFIALRRGVDLRNSSLADSAAEDDFWKSQALRR
jgi:hypothetical protein